MMKRLLAALVLSAALAMALIPGLALAADEGEALAAGNALGAQDASSQGLWVGNVEVTSANAGNITGSGISGKVSYNAATNTLTLNGATITGSHDVDEYYWVSGESLPYLYSTSYGIYQPEATTLTVKLVGTNKITFNYDVGVDDRGIALGKKDGKLVFTGSGSLAITGTSQRFCNGVRCADLQVDTGATVTSNVSAKDHPCYAVFSSGPISVAGTLSAIAANDQSANDAYGVYSAGDLTIKNGGKLVARATGSSYLDSLAYAVDCEGKLTVAGALTASAKGTTVYSLTVGKSGTIAKGGNLSVSADTTWQDYSTALWLGPESFTVNGTAKVSSDAVGVRSYSDGSTLTVGSTGNLVVTGEPAFSETVLKLASSSLKVLAGDNSKGAKATAASKIGSAKYVCVSTSGKASSDTDESGAFAVTSKAVKFSASKVKKKAQSVKAPKAFDVKNAKGAVTYKVAKYVTKGAKGKVSVANNGKVTVKKGTKKGTYKLKVKVTASNGSATVTLKVTVK